MNNLREAIAKTTDEVLVTMICQHFGSKLFSAITTAEAIGDKVEGHRIVAEIRESELLAGLPEAERLQVLERCDRADRLMEMEDH